MDTGWAFRRVLGWHLDLVTIPEGVMRQHMVKDAARYKHEIAFSSAYEQYKQRLAGQPMKDNLSLEEKSANHPSYTNYTPGWHATLDYIFYSDKSLPCSPS